MNILYKRMILNLLCLMLQYNPYLIISVNGCEKNTGMPIEMFQVN